MIEVPFSLLLLAGMGLTMIITRSSLIEPLKFHLGSKPKPSTVGKLLDCPQCFGFWVGGPLGLWAFMPQTLSDAGVIFLLCGLAVSGLSRWADRT